MNSIEKTSLTVAQLANGQTLSIPIYRLGAGNNGPKVYIQANVHGAEVQGNAVIFHLLEQLTQLPLNSDITLVPLANPLAVNHKCGEFTLGRFDPVTGTNWNRVYQDNSDLAINLAKQGQDWPAERLVSELRTQLIDAIDQKLASPFGITSGQQTMLQLQRMAHQADIVLDLHTGPISSRHLYCPEYLKDYAKTFNIEHVLFIPDGFAGAMDEACFCPWWALTQELAKTGREFPVAVDAFTVELGSQEYLNLDEAYDDALSILSYLQCKGVFTSDQFRPKAMTRYGCHLKDYKAVFAPSGGLVQYNAPLGQILDAGQPLATLLRMEQYGEADCVRHVTLPVPALPILHFASAAVNQGTELYKVFTQFFEL